MNAITFLVYGISQEHFSDLFRRYSGPVVVLDLVKQHERKPRESLVGKEFRDLVDELNNSIPMKDQIRYCALDYSRVTKASKNKHAVAASKPAVPGMAGVGQEWAMIESSLAASNGDDASASRSPRHLDTNFNNLRTSSTATPSNTVAGGGLNNFANAGASSNAGLGAAAVPPTPAFPDIRVDVLSELESIATMAIGETGIFCT